MPTATFAANGSSLLDLYQPNQNNAVNRVVGVYFLGASKTALYRTLLRFDVFGAAAEGRVLTASDIILAAELEWSIVTVVGPSAWGATIKHVARADWDPASATWNAYRTGSAWTAGGGDFDTPPADVAYTSPAVTGAFVVAGLLGFVTDAITNEGGVVRLAQKANDEAPASTRTYEGSPLVAPLLRVTYAAREPLPINDPHSRAIPGARAAPAARPANAAKPAPPKRASLGSGVTQVRTPTGDQRPATSDQETQTWHRTSQQSAPTSAKTSTTRTPPPTAGPTPRSTVTSAAPRSNIRCMRRANSVRR